MLAGNCQKEAGINRSFCENLRAGLFWRFHRRAAIALLSNLRELKITPCNAETSIGKKKGKQDEL